MVGRTKLKQNMLAVLKCVFLILQWYGDLSCHILKKWVLLISGQRGHLEVGISSAGEIMPPNVTANTLILLTSDFLLHGSLSFPLPSPSVLPGEGQHRQGHGVDDTGALASWSVALCLVVRLGATTPWLLLSELLFILGPHCRDTPGFLTQGALHVARLGPSTTSPGAMGRSRPS